MIKIYFNHEPQHINEKSSLLEFLTQRYEHQFHFAVAINEQFIPKGMYPVTFLNAEDRIDIITPMQGG